MEHIMRNDEHRNIGRPGQIPIDVGIALGLYTFGGLITSIPVYYGIVEGNWKKAVGAASAYILTAGGGLLWTHLYRRLR